MYVIYVLLKGSVKHMGMKFKVNSKPEKIVTAATAAVVLSILFDGKKKKLKHPEKYKSFPMRVLKYYKLSDSIMKKTVAKDLEKRLKEEADKEHFKDPVLENLEIENGEFIDI